MEQQKMSKIIYWGIKLDEASRARLLSQVPAVHNHVYAEHMTIVFNPDEKQNAKLNTMLGKTIPLTVIGEAKDEKGQAVVVEGFDRPDGGPEHITISCSPGTKAVYSNMLLNEGYTSIPHFQVQGVVAKYTDTGWKTQ